MNKSSLPKMKSVLTCLLSISIIYPTSRTAIQAMDWDNVNRIQFPSPFVLRGGYGGDRNNDSHRRRTKTKSKCRTIFKWKNSFPSEEDLCEMFDTNKPIRFNHDFVGITNPCLHSQNIPSLELQNSAASTILNTQQIAPTTTNIASSSTSSLTTTSNGMNYNNVSPDQFWIPDGINEYAMEQNQSQNHNSNKRGQQLYKQKNQPLRILRYRRRVGNGNECYTKLRDVVLQWERMHEGSDWAGMRVVKHIKPRRNLFHGHSFSKNRNLGNIHDERIESRVTQTTNSIDINALEDPYAPLPPNVSENVMQLWADPGGRKLVTMSRIGGKSSIWAMNPCVVVYDLVDCRGKDMIYTSTAYATLQGHLLAGEERVTVAIRDGERTCGNPRLNNIVFNNDASNCVASKSHSDLQQRDSGGAGDVYVEILSCSRPSQTLLGRAIFPFVKGMQDRFFKEQIDTLERIARDSESDQ